MAYYKCCEHCGNNPENNPHASGICFCALPAMEAAGGKSKKGSYSKTYTTNRTTTNPQNTLLDARESPSATSTNCKMPTEESDIRLFCNSLNAIKGGIQHQRPLIALYLEDAQEIIMYLWEELEKERNNHE